MATPFEAAYEDLINAKIRHVPFNMPLAKAGTDTLISKDWLGLKFHRYGLSYFSYHTGGNPAEYQALFNDGKLEELVEKINADWTAHRGYEKLIAAIYKGQVVGVVSRYMPVDNLEIMDAIAVRHLQKYVTHHFLNEMVFKIHMAVTVAKQHLVTLLIKNGHSGHIAFSYGAAFSAGAYEFEYPLVDHVRHLSSVSSVFHNLHDIIRAIEEIKIDTLLRNVEIDRCVAWIDASFPEETRSLKQSQLLSTVLGQSPANALEFVSFLGQYSNQRGYKGSVKTIADLILKETLGDPS